MKRNEPVSHIMTRDLQTVHVGQKLSEVRRMLANNPYHHVPVVSGDKLIGLISSTDMVRLSLSVYGVDERAFDAMLDTNHTIESVMTRNLQTIKVMEVWNLWDGYLIFKFDSELPKGPFFLHYTN